MINLYSLQISYHFQNDRQGRKERIDRIVNGNWGQVVKEEWYKDAYRCLTDTGLIFIVNAEKTMILTYYFARMNVVNGMFSGKIPSYIVKRINKNAKLYANVYKDKMKNEYNLDHKNFQ